jgi:hypothetical protein
MMKSNADNLVKKIKKREKMVRMHRKFNVKKSKKGVVRKELVAIENN